MKETKKLKVTFCAGAETVTGANFLLEGEDKKFLVDCGLTQGTKLAEEVNWEPFPYDPKEIDILFITHAHIDHIGRIPKLIHDGFQGRIYSTAPTKDIAEVMLMDTVNILGRIDDFDLKKIYTEEAVRKAMNLWEGLRYHQPLKEGPFTFVYRDAGHILGSGMVEILYNGKKILFTGDLGNSPSPLLPDTEKVTDADYLIMESVYGDRNHESRNLRKKRLEAVMEDNYRRKGTLVIPTFSLERSQELLLEINDLVEHKRIPVMPIFFDSPLAINLTRIYRSSQEYFNKEVRSLISGGDDIFNFPGLKVTYSTEASKSILHSPDPKIIIAGSGMSNGGRVIHHEKNYLPNANNTLLLIGYQALGTMGRLIQDGNKKVTIAGEKIPVKAKVEMINGYSGHKDSDGLLNFVQDTSETVRKVFAVMGEPKSSLYLVQKLRDYLGVDASAPQAGESVELEC